MIVGQLARLALLAALATGCGGAPPMPGTQVASSDRAALPLDAEPPAKPPIAAVGERMTYRVSLHGVALAELVIDVSSRARVEDRDTLVVAAHTDTLTLASLVNAVHDRFTSWIDVQTGRSIQFHAQEAVTHDTHLLEETEAIFHPGSYAVHLLKGEVAGVDEQQVVRGPPYDFTAWLIFLRGWEAPVGSELTADVMRSRFVWRVRMVVGGHGNLLTSLGELPVVRFEGDGVRILRDGTVDPTSDHRRFTIWISDDADRVPVKLAAHTDYGDVLLELAAYNPGD